ncbi:two-component system response regulator [Subtercola sp. Z020]|uniref:response regulator n=1 Tax=Subtercola sp. Z020 TaxID=2080582 RepID=UPI000CE79E5A|nr:response regulator [Subtercola sp. Z020]PPF75297.1 two-component system response regulator [Subtercola sp. Z020]
MSGGPMRVLIVDDEEITASAHAAYVERLTGFSVAGVAHTGHEAIRLLRRPDTVDLVLLDMNLPDTHGLDLCRQIRSAGLDLDVIAITAVREVGVVRASVSLGIVQYLIKPFTFATFADRMRSYLDFRRSFDDDGRLLATQGDVDHTLGALRTVAPPAHDKGLSEGTLQLVVAALAAAPSALSATELSDSAAISRVTARRYLEHLVASGAATKSARYGAPEATRCSR